MNGCHNHVFAGNAKYPKYFSWPNPTSHRILDSNSGLLLVSLSLSPPSTPVIFSNSLPVNKCRVSFIHEYLASQHYYYMILAKSALTVHHLSAVAPTDLSINAKCFNSKISYYWYFFYLPGHAIFSHDLLCSQLFHRTHSQSRKRCTFFHGFVW